MTRTDWTRAEIADAFRSSVHRARVPRGGGASRASRGGRGAALHPAVDQDRRVPGGLRLLLAIGACRHGSEGREADGRRRGDRRRARGEGAWVAALLHGRGVARAQGPRHARALRDGRGREGDGPRDLHDARHADAGEQARAARKDAGLDYYNHNIDTSPEHYGDIITTRTFQERLDTLEEVRKAGMAVCCGGIVGMGETPRGPRRLHPRAGDAAAPSRRACRSTRWCRSRARCSATCGASRWPIDDIEFVRTVAVARITMPQSMVRLSAGRESMSRERRRRSASWPARTAIFTGDKLLTAPNAGDDSDAALFAKLGLKPLRGEEPMRACARAEAAE